LQRKFLTYVNRAGTLLGSPAYHEHALRSEGAVP
jgi:hypothetical protein